MQERAAQSADERSAPGERQRVGSNGVDHRNQSGDSEARHHGVADVLLAHHAAVEEPEPRDRHHEHERDRRQHPGCVAAAWRAVRQHSGDGRDCGVFVGLRDGGAGRRARGRRWRRRLCRCGGRGAAAAGAAAAGASVAAGAAACARTAAGARPMKTAAASAGARRESFGIRFIVRELQSGMGNSALQVRARPYPSRPCGFAPPS